MHDPQYIPAAPAARIAIRSRSFGGGVGVVIGVVVELMRTIVGHPPSYGAVVAPGTRTTSTVPGGFKFRALKFCTIADSSCPGVRYCARIVPTTGIATFPRSSTVS